MHVSFCSLAAVAAVVTLLAGPQALATRTDPASLLPFSSSREETGLELNVRPGRIEVAVWGADDRPVWAGDAWGKAVLEVNGRLLGVALMPAGGNVLAGMAPFTMADSVQAEITVSVGGQILTARYSRF